MNPYWIESGSIRLAILPRPRGNDWLSDDVAAARRAGVDVIVSALTNEETEELGLADEGKCCRESGVQFLSFPIEDRSLPRSPSDFRMFLNSVDQEIKKNKSVAIHCRAGIGRSSMLCACLLVLHGFSTDQAFETIQKARGCPVPDTDEQRRWVDDFALGFKAP